MLKDNASHPFSTVRLLLHIYDYNSLITTRIKHYINILLWMDFIILKLRLAMACLAHFLQCPTANYQEMFNMQSLHSPPHFPPFLGDCLRYDPLFQVQGGVNHTFLCEYLVIQHHEWNQLCMS